MLVDRHGRTATDLRVSLTDRCNLRCTYCMPAESLHWLAKPELLTDDEIVRLTGIAVTELGVTEVRFTGGEPLLRPGLVSIVERCAQLTPRPQLSLTTNGIGLQRTAHALRAAGLDRVNVSLDTLRPDVFVRLTRRDRHADVLAGLAAARAAGLGPVKVNAVLMPGVNGDEAPELLAWAMEHGYELRFIEQMPLDAQHGWRRTSMLTATDIVASPRSHPRSGPSAGPNPPIPIEPFLSHCQSQARGALPADRTCWIRVRIGCSAPTPHVQSPPGGQTGSFQPPITERRSRVSHQMSDSTQRSQHRTSTGVSTPPSNQPEVRNKDRARSVAVQALKVAPKH